MKRRARSDFVAAFLAVAVTVFVHPFLTYTTQIYPDLIAAVMFVIGSLMLFDPAGLANPGKIFPTPRLCGEVPGPYRAHPLEKAGLAERF